MEQGGAAVKHDSKKNSQNPNTTWLYNISKSNKFH